MILLIYSLGINSFTSDPPNGVLVSGEEQKTYELKTARSDGKGNYTIELKLIDGEIHSNTNHVSGPFSFFVDNFASALVKGVFGLLNSNKNPHRNDASFYRPSNYVGEEKYF